MSEAQLPPKFGASNPALENDHDPWGQEVFTWIFGVMVVIFCIYWAVGLTANLVARRISDEQEAKWFSGERVVSLVGIDVVDGTDVLDFSRCKDLLAAMTAGGALRQLPYNMYISKSKTPNAFAVPGGHIIVTQGLLDLVKSDMGLAMVLAHELGHHQFRDPLRGMGRSLSLSLLVSLFMGGQSPFVKLVMNILNSSYSRDQELRADKFGFQLVSSTFHRTAGALEFFEKISEHETSKIHELGSMLSTHPYGPDRIKVLKQLDLELNNGKRFDP